MSKYSIFKIPKDYQREIAEKHKFLRKKRGWSQEELARRSGISLGSLKRFEQKGRVSFESLLQLAHTLGRLDDFQNIFFYNTEMEEVKKMFNE